MLALNLNFLVRSKQFLHVSALGYLRTWKHEALRCWKRRISCCPKLNFSWYFYRRSSYLSDKEEFHSQLKLKGLNIFWGCTNTSEPVPYELEKADFVLKISKNSDRLGHYLKTRYIRYIHGQLFNTLCNYVFIRKDVTWLLELLSVFQYQNHRITRRWNGKHIEVDAIAEITLLWRFLSVEHHPGGNITVFIALFCYHQFWLHYMTVMKQKTIFESLRLLSITKSQFITYDF